MYTYTPYIISPCRGGVGAGLTGSWGGGGECGAMFSPWLRHEVTVPRTPRILRIARIARIAKR